MHTLLFCTNSLSLGLAECTSINHRVVCVCLYDWWCTVMVTADAPGEPKDVAIDKFDRSSVTLKWKAPNDDGGNPIKGLH